MSANTPPTPTPTRTLAGLRPDPMAYPRAHHLQAQRARRWLVAATIMLALIGSTPLVQGIYMLAKAQLAQWLIEQAWDDNLKTGTTAHRPWPWADLSPVAKLSFERQQSSHIVLDNDAPRTLAFGPGLRAGSPAPAHGGNSVISAHRDTHFAALAEVAIGDPIRVQTLNGQSVRYRVAERRIVDVSDGWIAEDQGRDELSLVTCWPMDALHAGGRERLVVTAIRVTDTDRPEPSWRQAKPKS